STETEVCRAILEVNMGRLRRIPVNLRPLNQLHFDQLNRMGDFDTMKARDSGCANAWKETFQRGCVRPWPHGAFPIRWSSTLTTIPSTPGEGGRATGRGDTDYGGCWWRPATVRKASTRLSKYLSSQAGTICRRARNQF